MNLLLRSLYHTPSATTETLNPPASGFAFKSCKISTPTTRFARLPGSCTLATFAKPCRGNSIANTATHLQSVLSVAANFSSCRFVMIYCGTKWTHQNEEQEYEFRRVLVRGYPYLLCNWSHGLPVASSHFWPMISLDHEFAFATQAAHSMAGRLQRSSKILTLSSCPT